jgi:uncharacterized membrane protein YgdD (TMEM256/DUF423 family)
MTLRQFCVAASSLFGTTAVIGGAFGAHALAHSRPDQAAVLKTAVQYQLIHAVVLLVLSILATSRIGLALRMSAACITAGTFLFSASLAFISILDWRWVGPITPLGGILLIVGWVSLGFIRPDR